MKAVIVCNGKIEDYSYYTKYFDDAGLIICADGGARHIKSWGIVPDVLMGDFDSISTTDLEHFRQSGTEIIKYPAEKDMTDSELAVEYALAKGSTAIVLLGVLGTRMDHSISNILLLKRLLDRGVEGCIADENNEILLIRDRISLRKQEDSRVSLIPVSPKAKGVTTEGLYYPLNKADIDMGSTWGVSNEFIDDVAEISIDEGLLLVIKSRD